MSSAGCSSKFERWINRAIELSFHAPRYRAGLRTFGGQGAKALLRQLISRGLRIALSRFSAMQSVKLSFAAWLFQRRIAVSVDKRITTFVEPKGLEAR
jgi:hypothetical protein